MCCRPAPSRRSDHRTALKGLDVLCLVLSGAEILAVVIGRGAALGHIELADGEDPIDLLPAVRRQKVNVRVLLPKRRIGIAGQGRNIVVLPSNMLCP